MRQFQVYHPLWMAFYSRPLYREVGLYWTGLALLYLCLLLSLAWLPPLVKAHVGLRRWVQSDAERVLSQFPRVAIHNGDVRVDPPGRHLIKDPDTGKPFIIIDTEATVEELAELSKESILLTRSKLVFQRAQGRETRIYDLGNVQNLAFTQDDLRRWLGIGANMLAPFLFPFLLAGSFLYRLVQVLIYALIGMLFARSAGVALKYDTLVRLSVMAITPAVILDVLQEFSSVKVPLWWLVCFLVAMGYLHFGIKACKNLEPHIAEPAAIAA